MGVYGSFEEALRAAPQTAPVGYNHASAASLYEDMVNRVQAKDYPALYWLRRTLDRASTVFDFGGNVGISYYAYQKYLAGCGPSHWTVCDVPAVINAGSRRAVEQGATALQFTSSFSDASGCDVLFTAGTLQYIESPFDALVETLFRRPAHIVVNMMPTLPDRTVITLQNIGISYCAYRIIERGALAPALQRLGYVLEDEWINPETRTRMPYADDMPGITWIGQYYRLAVS
ncbi:MAG: methyltransferase, TIGR04325 family [Gemmatimonadaceae bacterium]|nr:methyltransferase, TIGR04325 family [Gemmatimonadaceae bacterium]